MKKLLHKTRFNKSAISGAMMIEFIVIIGLALSFVVAALEVGFALKSEALIIGVTQQVARKVAATGQLTSSDVTNFATKLNNNEIKDVEVVVKYKDYNSTTPLDYSIGNTLSFRQNFTVYVKGKHTMKLASFFNSNIDFPLAFSRDGTVEKFTP